MVHVMEFRHRGIARFEHLDVELAGDDLQLLRRDLPDQPVHEVAPGPEAVIGVADDLGKPGHGPLERVGVHIRHTGK